MILSLTFGSFIISLSSAESNVSETMLKHPLMERLTSVLNVFFLMVEW